MRKTQAADPAETRKFEAMAEEWWDPGGKFRPLHMLNPCRLEYISDQVSAEFGRDLDAPQPFKGLDIIDIGCGGGLLAEPMARLGARVTGIDPVERNIQVAKAHMARSGLKISYRAATAEDLAPRRKKFDVALFMEVVEHVPDPAASLGACASLLRPGGMLVCSTINRTAASFALAIVGAEYVMRWLPAGTHDWSKFIKPGELNGMIRGSGLEPVDLKGFVFSPLRWEWRVSSRDLAVNYVTASVKPKAL